MSPILEPAGSPLTYTRCSLGGVGSASHMPAYGMSVCIRLILPRISCERKQDSTQFRQERVTFYLMAQTLSPGKTQHGMDQASACGRSSQ